MSNTIEFRAIPVKSLFVLPGIGVLRKTGNMTATTKGNKQHVIYPNEHVSEMRKRATKAGA